MSNTTAPRNVRTTALTIRVDEGFAARVNAHLDRLRTKNPRLQISMTDTIRDLLHRGLDDAERTR